MCRRSIKYVSSGRGPLSAFGRCTGELCTKYVFGYGDKTVACYRPGKKRKSLIGWCQIARERKGERERERGGRGRVFGVGIKLLCAAVRVRMGKDR